MSQPLSETLAALATRLTGREISLNSGYGSALRRPEVSSAITGASKASHVLSNVKASEIQLEEELLEKIAEILDNDPTE